MAITETKFEDNTIADTDLTRRLLFISHANPQDNAAAAWFSTQLTLLGYEVWCDLQNTHGSESEFWLKVQKKIEQEAAKFIFLLSDTSRDLENKRGVYKELQAADNTGQDNFIIPIRIEKLHGSLPIMIAPDLYIDGENWLDGLRELRDRLEHDDVPRAEKPNLERIASWWPAASARKAVVADEPGEVVTNVFSFRSLPEKIHFLKVYSEGNLLSGQEQLSKALPNNPAHRPFKDYAVSFGCAHDYQELTHEYEFDESLILQTEDFLEFGHLPIGIEPQTARNIATYLTASSFEAFLAAKGLEHKKTGRGRRMIWYPAYGTIDKNKHSISEPGSRKSPVSFVGRLTHFGKPYIWHFGTQPIVDLHTFRGILFSPRAMLSKPYRSDEGDKPYPVDEKKALKKLGWWNNEWRRKILGFAAWLAEDQSCMYISAGYQTIVVSAVPDVYVVNQSYLTMDDDTLMRTILGEDHG